MKHYSRKEIDEALQHDALDTVEQIICRPYQKDSGLALEFVTRKHEVLKRMAQSTNDTYYNCPWDYFLQVMKEHGFQRQWYRPFLTAENKQETQYEGIWYKAPGVVLYAYSYRQSVSSGQLMYNWEPGKGKHVWDYNRGTGGPLVRIRPDGSHDISGKNPGQDVWPGYINVTETVMHHYYGLVENGTFVEPWKLDPGVHMVNFTEKEKKQYNQTSLDKISLLPGYIQTIMQVSVDELKQWLSDIS